MIAFRPRRWWEEILYRLLPTYRRKQDQALRLAIEELVHHPELPCLINNQLVPDGYGDHPFVYHPFS